MGDGGNCCSWGASSRGNISLITFCPSLEFDSGERACSSGALAMAVARTMASFRRLGSYCSYCEDPPAARLLLIAVGSKIGSNRC